MIGSRQAGRHGRPLGGLPAIPEVYLRLCLKTTFAVNGPNQGFALVASMLGSRDPGSGLAVTAVLVSD